MNIYIFHHINLIISFTLAFNLIFISAYQRTIKIHQCIHDQIMKDHPPKFLDSPTTDAGRNLVAESAATIRITTDFQGVNTLLSSGLPMANYIKKLVDQAQIFFQDLLTVIPYQQAITLPSGSSCLNYTIPSNHEIFSVGIQNSDIHFFVTATDEPTSSFLAYAGSCYFRTGTRKIPIIGRINWNYHYIKDCDLTSNRIFQDNLETAIHEFLHAFGFSGSLIKNNMWFNLKAGTTYTVANILLENQQIRNLSTNLLATPNVLQTAKDYYNCQTLQGMQLENQGSSGSVGSHWERTILGNEIMTASASILDSVFTQFTVALLKDTGYYESVRESPVDQIFWGKNRGCGFVYKACKDSGQTYPEFCTAAQATVAQKGCNYEFSGFGICDSTDQFGDTCPYYSTYSNRYCLDSTQTAFKTYTKFSFTSRCFSSTLLPYDFSGGGNFFDCFEASCTNSPTQIRVSVGTQTYVCTTPNQVITAQSGHSGSLTCPSDFFAFCNSVILCPNSCSQNGYCLGKQCYCNTQYAGEDCSTSCAYVLYNSQCQSQCPAYYYKKSSSKVCEACHAACSVCTGKQNTVCSRCKTNYFLSGTTCDSTCPTNYYKDLQKKICVTSCPQYYYKDSSTQSCVTQCPNNQVANAQTGICQASCGIGTYFDSLDSKCKSQCPIGYFGDSIQKTCVKQCTNGYQGNQATRVCDLQCTSNQFKDVQSGNCVSQCQNGYFGVSSSQLCVATCPSNTYGDVLQNRICTNSCSGTQYGDPSNNLCVTQCSSKYQYKNTITKLCVSACSNAVYTDVVLLNCISNCPSGRTVNNNLMKCLPSCSVNQFYDLQTSSCVSQCPSGKFGDPINIICATSCPSGYQQDSNTRLCIILSCSGGNFLNSVYNCVSKCPTGYFGNKLTNKCVTTCPTNYFSESDTALCLESCPIGKFKDSVIWTCTSKCSTGYYSDPVLNECTQNCTQGYIVDNSTQSCIQSISNMLLTFKIISFIIYLISIIMM